MHSCDDLYAIVKKSLSSKRFLHTVGVEREAVTLALRWGIDPMAARRAAILHDVTKEVEDQLKLCEKYAIMPDGWAIANHKLFHAQTGAEEAKGLGESDEVVSAIRWHTTGRPNMTKLEKVLYLADFVEPFRKNPEWLSELRGLVYEDLDKAMLKGLEMSIVELLQRRQDIHPSSSEALAWFSQKNSAGCGPQVASG